MRMALKVILRVKIASFLNHRRRKFLKSRPCKPMSLWEWHSHSKCATCFLLKLPEVNIFENMLCKHMRMALRVILRVKIASFLNRRRRKILKIRPCKHVRMVLKVILRVKIASFLNRRRRNFLKSRPCKHMRMALIVNSHSKCATCFLLKLPEVKKFENISCKHMRMARTVIISVQFVSFLNCRRWKFLKICLVNIWEWHSESFFVWNVLPF